MANDPPMAREVEELKASDLDALEKIAKAATRRFDECQIGVGHSPSVAEQIAGYIQAFEPNTALALIALARRSLPSPEAGGAE